MWRDEGAEVIVLIPAYEPDHKLVDLLRKLRHHRVVVVDDGSGPRYAGIFAQVCALGADLISLPENRGKGYALKTGFTYIQTHYPGRDVVCADSDGQHHPDDIDAVAAALSATGAAMVLGARRFTGKVPLRSKFGNSMTRAAYAVATRHTLIDTQTGLRAYPARMLPWLGEVPGNRFEYELRLLLKAARDGLRIEEVEISTIYLEGNASSHFHPLYDSLRVYAPLFAFVASSVLAFAIDTTALLVFAGLTGSVARSAVAARLISATVNYGVNRVWVFGRHGGGPASRKVSAPRYAILALALFAVNVVLLKALTIALGVLIVAKVITEVSLFAISYLVQKYVVFAPPAPQPVVDVAVPELTTTPIITPMINPTRLPETNPASQS